MINHKSKPTVFIIEDDTAVCKSLRWLFESVDLSVEVYNNGCDYLKAYDPGRIGCLLIDIRLPGMSGLELQQQLVQRSNPIPIIIITGHGDVTLAVRAMKAGAKDFILKPFNDELLLEQIQKAILESREYNTDKHQFAEHLARLTPREKEVLELMVKGRLNKQIAVELRISLSTVEQHRAHVMQKTQAGSLAELVRRYTLTKQKLSSEL